MTGIASAVLQDPCSAYDVLDYVSKNCSDGELVCSFLSMGKFDDVSKNCSNGELVFSFLSMGKLDYVSKNCSNGELVCSFLSISKGKLDLSKDEL